jgi:transposase-like protein/IS1 family transposase
MNCPGCGSLNHHKAGFVTGRQWYKCKDCQYCYTVERESDVKSSTARRLAFEMYLEGLGFRSIGHILNISYGAVYQWVKEWAEKVELPKKEESVDLVELDEMHTYVGQKNCRRIWITVDRFGRRYLSFVCGDRSTRTGLKLWHTLKCMDITSFASDYWKSYEEFISPGKHLQTKAETYTVESYNS